MKNLLNASVALTLGCFVFAENGSAAVTHKGYRLTHYGQVDTDLRFSEFFTGAHTISAWVMPEFVYNYNGPIFGVKGSGSFTVGQGDYRTGNGGYKLAGDPVLSIKVNTTEARYLAPGYQRRRWNHIAVTRAPLFNGWVFLLYLNGQLLTPINNHVTTTTTYSPSGTLRLGRTNSDMYGPQFYGHIDDVAIFNKAMSASEIVSLMNNGIPLTNLIAGYTFNVVTGVLQSPKFTRPVIANSRAFHVNLAYPRNTAVDRALFDNPAYVSPTSVAQRLPFPKGQIWRVIQEFDSRAGSHNGYAAFAWDFGRMDAPTKQDPVIASAAGQVVYANDGANGAIRVQVVTNLEYNQYMHTAAGSFTQLVFDPSGHLWWPDPAQSTTWLAVQAGQQLVKLDPTQNHLHFSIINEGALNPNGRSIPGAFIDYEFSTDQGLTWKWVWRGMPRAGQWVRRTN